jgi:hypothetical protein
MASEDLDALEAALTDEESRLRAELGTLHDDLHGGLRNDLHHNSAAISAIEIRIRTIVLRLTQIERDRIELNIVRAL